MVPLILLGYLTWIGVVAWRLIAEPLPRPTDVVLISIFFYNVPLALVAIAPAIEALTTYSVFLNNVAGDQRIAQKTILLTILASTSVAAGRLVAGFVWKPSRQEITVRASVRLQRTTANLSLVFLLTAVLGIALFGVDDFLSGYAAESKSENSSSGTALTFFAYEAIGICSFTWFCCLAHTGKRPGQVLIAIALLSLLAITAARGKRLELIIALLPLALLLWTTRLTRPRHRILALSFAILLISSLASLRYGQIPDIASLAFNTFSEGLYAGHVTPGVIEALDNRWINPEYGIRFVAALGAFIPRFLLPGKDELIYQSLTDMLQFAPLGATSMLAEVYLQGSAVAVAIAFTFIGAAARPLEMKTLLGADRRFPVRSMLYIVFVCSFVPHFRDGIIPAIKIPLQLLFVISVVMLVSGDVSRRRSPKLRQKPNLVARNVSLFSIGKDHDAAIRNLQKL